MDSPDLSGLRDRMVSQVAASGRPVSDAVALAMRAVPRHLFLPGTDPELAYRNEPIVTRRSADGQPTSSSSQPTIMAYMLDQLDVAPGHRVLEIGAGTGYNAALLAHLVGAAGTVVTVDLDEDVADQARAHLAAAGYPDVTVLAADGAAGYPPGAPYDRIIATVGVSDLAPAWRDQLVPGGRIVVPLDLRGSQRSVAFEWDGTSWQSRSVIPCGFMRMRGTLAGPERTRVTRDIRELALSLPDDRDIDIVARSRPAGRRPGRGARHPGHGRAGAAVRRPGPVAGPARAALGHPHRAGHRGGSGPRSAGVEGPPHDGRCFRCGRVRRAGPPVGPACARPARLGPGGRWTVTRLRAHRARLRAGRSRPGRRARRAGPGLGHGRRPEAATSASAATHVPAPSRSRRARSSNGRTPRSWSGPPEVA